MGIFSQFQPYDYVIAAACLVLDLVVVFAPERDDFYVKLSRDGTVLRYRRPWREIKPYLTAVAVLTEMAMAMIYWPGINLSVAAEIELTVFLPLIIYFAARATPVSIDFDLRSGLWSRQSIQDYTHWIRNLGPPMSHRGTLDELSHISVERGSLDGKNIVCRIYWGDGPNIVIARPTTRESAEAFAAGLATQLQIGVDDRLPDALIWNSI